MIQHTFRSIAATVVFCVTAISTTGLLAQLPQTRLKAIWPVGGQSGQELELTITSGDDLEEVTRLIFSDERITATLKSTNVFTVNIAADVPVGLYEVRCGGLWGFSNPRRFSVDRQLAVFESSDNNSPEKANPVEMNTIVNGRLETGNDVDWFKFSAKQGQRVVLDCWAERLDSRMDAVIAVYDSTGRRRLNWSRNSIGVDPVLVFDVPADGDYLIEVHDVTYQNSPEFFYRLKVHTGPHVEFAWPPIATAGTTAHVTLFGYNLPNSQVTEQQINGAALESIEVDINVAKELEQLKIESRIAPVAAGTDAFSYRFASGDQLTDPIRIGVTELPVITEVEPNTEGSQAQTIAGPVEIGGQFGQAGDSDAFRFEAKKGQVWMIEANSERLGTNADPFLIVNRIVKQPDGNETVSRLTLQDDIGTNLLQNVFETHSDDPVFRLEVPEDGLYEVILRDRYWESRGNALLRYSLAIRPERQDFRVVAVPSAPAPGQTWPTSLRKGDQFPVTLLAFRKDGYNGPIEVTALGLPQGLLCPSTVIASGETSSAIVISAAEDAPVGIHEIQFYAQATVANSTTAGAVEAARTALGQAQQTVTELTKSVEVTKQNIVLPQAALDAAVKASESLPNDENLKNLVTVGQKAIADLQAVHTAAIKAVEPAQAAVVAATEKLQVAEQDHAAATHVRHLARTGTIVWSGGNNVPAIARLTNTMNVSVMDEAAPFQVKTEPQRLTVNQGRQILIPVELVKRQGFDDKVTLDPQGLPKNANIDLPKIEIAKGEANKTVRMFVKENSPPGIYTAWMNSAGQVAYRRNPAKAERAKQAHEDAKAKAEAAKQAEQAETQKKNDAVAALEAAKKAAEQATLEVQTVQAEVKTLKTAQRDAALALNMAQLKAAESEVSLRKLESEILKLSGADSNSDVGQKLSELQNQIAVAKEQLTAAREEVTAMSKTLEGPQAALDQGLAKLSKATEHQQAMAAAVPVAEKNKVDAEAAEKAAQEAAKAAEAARQAAEKAATDAENAAKPNNMNFTPPTMPIVIEVLPAPVKLAVTPANGGKVKKGETVEVTIQVTRQNGFEGPVTIDLSAPGVAGVNAGQVEIPADQTEVKLNVQTTTEAADGKPETVIVRATMPFNGEAEVNAPLPLEITN